MDNNSFEDSPKISLTTAIFIVIANIIGTGVFTILGFQVKDLNSVFAILFLWLIGGVVSFFGALCYGEIGVIYPRCGAEYHYLSKIFHPSIGFLSGFVSVFVGFSAPIALAAMALSAYLRPFILGIKDSIIAIGVVIIISIIHASGIKKGEKFQIFFTSIKLLLILSFCFFGYFYSPHQKVSFLPSYDDISTLFSAPFAVSLIYVSYAYSGWNASAYIASEIKEVKKNLPKSLLIGTFLTTLLYLLLNAVFILTAPLSELSGKIEVGFISAGYIFGEVGSRIMSALIGLCLVSTISAMVWSGSRVLQVMSEDYPFLKVLAKKNKYGAPARAIFLQLIIVIILILTSTFEKLITYLGFTLTLFTSAVVLGVIVLRIKSPELNRPFKTWGYPVVPIIFLLIQLWTIIFVVKEKFFETLLGFLTLILGLVIYFLFARKREGIMKFKKYLIISVVFIAILSFTSFKESEKKEFKLEKKVLKVTKEEVKKEKETSKIELNENSIYLTSIGRTLAGIKSSGEVKFDSLYERASFLKHSKKMNSLWKLNDKKRMKKLNEWAEKYLKEVDVENGTLFYPFGGPDCLYPTSLFPSSITYVLIGLEPVGTIPDLLNMKEEEFDATLSLMGKALEPILLISFYRTNDMKVDLEERGVVPLIMATLAGTGYEIVDVKPYSLKEDGSLTFSEWGSKKTKVVEIQFFKPQSNLLKKLYYLSYDLSNTGISKNGEFKAYLDNLSPTATFIKSATYLLHKNYFNILRNYILTKSPVVLQDDSGIPYRFFNNNDWTITLFGTYEKPIELFKEHYQKDLYEVYRNSEVQPLPFGIGYHHWANKSNLLLAKRKK